jgi:hypothetical protein
MGAGPCHARNAGKGKVMEKHRPKKTTPAKPSRNSVAEVSDRALDGLSEALHAFEGLASDAQQLSDDIYRQVRDIRAAFNRIGIDV